jgi:2-polyprenyl-3-methyl-5-hydroxy-6-metoxy-1,4-benzoquinol methylase
MLTRVLDLLGDLDGRAALDAGCGEGLLARAMADRGARVTAIDASPRLIHHAQVKDTAKLIDYRIGDLSRPHPELAGHFEAIGSFLVLNDVRDHRGFARTLADLARPGARLALALNNPYSAVVREHVHDYFDTTAMGTYHGLGTLGIAARYYHRTLEEYLDAFLAAGLRLATLVDIPETAGRDWLLPAHCRFPLFMILAFEKP